MQTTIEHISHNKTTKKTFYLGLVAGIRLLPKRSLYGEFAVPYTDHSKMTQKKQIFRFYCYISKLKPTEYIDSVNINQIIFHQQHQKEISNFFVLLDKY